MGFEWDPAKAKSNYRKHGVLFADAVAALEDENAISVRDASEDEERWVSIGMDALARLLVVVLVARRKRTYDFGAARNSDRKPPVRGRLMKKEYDFSKGRRGPVVRVAPEKVRVTIRLDKDILDWFRRQVDDAGGGNYQTLINDALRGVVERKQEALESMLRRIIRDELKRAG